MSQINRVPWGLQSLLGSQNFGKNPAQLVEAVQPTLDQQTFLGYETLRAEADYQIINAVGGACELTVPDNEAWGLLGIAGDTRVAATTEYYMNVLLAFPANAGGAFLKFHNFGYYSKTNASSSAIGSGLSVMLPIPIVFGPGTRFQNILAEATITSVDMRLTVLYYRYDV